MKTSQKLVYTVAEACEQLSISRAQLYRLMDMGQLASIKVGRSRRVTAKQLDAFVHALEQQSGFSTLRA